MVGDVLLTAHRLFPTIVRFDMAYVTIMKCNWKHIRYDYPNLHRWLRQLYWETDPEAKGAFKRTTHFDIVSYDPQFGAKMTFPFRHNRKNVDEADYRHSLWKGMQNPR